jgi:ADP-ribose pyrophosphatase
MLGETDSLFTHCARCGQPGLDRPEPTAYHCRACGFFYHVNPAVGAGAILLDAAEQILLLRRANDPDKGKLGLPGGFVDAGESVEEALRREIREETGLTADHFDYVGSWPNRYPFRGVTYNVVDLFFVGRIASFAAATARHEVAGLCVQPLSEVWLADIAFPSVRAAIDRCRKLQYSLPR